MKFSVLTSGKSLHGWVSVKTLNLMSTFECNSQQQCVHELEMRLCVSTLTEPGGGATVFVSCKGSGLVLMTDVSTLAEPGGGATVFVSCKGSGHIC